MANYFGMARSNYIFWDPAKLEALKQIFSIKSVESNIFDGTQAVISADQYGTPTAYLDPDDDSLMQAADLLGIISLEEITKNKLLGLDTDIEEHLDFLDYVHLAFAEDIGGLFVWTYSGHEANRYVDGGAIALDATGEVVHQITLSDIYALPDVKTKAWY